MEENAREDKHRKADTQTAASTRSQLILMKWDWLAGGVIRHAYYWHSYDSRVSFYQDCDARDAHGKIP